MVLKKQNGLGKIYLVIKSMNTFKMKQNGITLIEINWVIKLLNPYMFIIKQNGLTTEINKLSYKVNESVYT